MRIDFLEISNFRKLKSTRLDFDEQTTIFVGANNSGKTSAMLALRIFLCSPDSITLRDVTIGNWSKIDILGKEWEEDKTETTDLNTFLPTLDVWLDVQLDKIRHVTHIIPTLDWNGGRLGVRLSYRIKDLQKLKADYLAERRAAKDAQTKDQDGKPVTLDLWPRTLTHFLERRLRGHQELLAYPLDPKAIEPPGPDGTANPQVLSNEILPFEKLPFKKLIKIDEIAAQRDFADTEHRTGREDMDEGYRRRFKRRLSDQLRSYYDRHLDPAKTPSGEDYEALFALQGAQRSFDERLEARFSDAFKELENIGYPGLNDPRLKISTRLRATDGLKHDSAVQYQVASPPGEENGLLTLPEDYSGLGYRNLIAMVFMLMGFRDDWMRIKKAAIPDSATSQDEIQPLHLVLVEEPEAHLHAQVQQVFIKKAYQLLRNHCDLEDRDTYRTQLIVSTHSSHVAHEADFSCLRYFRRRHAKRKGEMPVTTVVNLSNVFKIDNDTTRFVKRYLKVTHCDLFFADGVVFVEGQAERILIPHFIHHHFSNLSRRYITLIEVSGSHAHKFRPLIEALGITTLVIADLDATEAGDTTDKKGTKSKRYISVMPEFNKGQKTANPVLKYWHPKKEDIDELIALQAEEHEAKHCQGHRLYVAYQKTVKPEGKKKYDSEIIPRTFEDALILENIDLLKTIEGSGTSKKISRIVEQGLSGDNLKDELFQLLKTANKADFAIDCLMHEKSEALTVPDYIKEGLIWFDKAVGEDIEGSNVTTGQVNVSD